MEIANLAAGVTSLTNKEIETAIQSLGFTMVHPTAANADPKTAFINTVGGAVVNIVKQNGNDTQSLIQSISLKDLAELATHNDGVIHMITDGTEITANFTIEVALAGAIALGDNEKLMLGITALPATSTTVIDGHDHPISTTTYIKYETKYVNENVSKDFNTKGVYAIALPAGSVTALEMTYSNGKNVKLNSREIERELTNSQDTIYNKDGVITLGFGSWYVLSVEHVDNCRVTLSDSTNFYLLREQSI